MKKKILYFTIALTAILVAVILGCYLSVGYNAHGLIFDNVAQESVSQSSTKEQSAQSDTTYSEDSFAYFLQNLPTKHGVYYWNGEFKNDNLAIDFDVSKNQQCADAVIRLHAEWLWSQKRYDEIHYNFVNGFRADYTRYANGERIKTDGNNAHWVKTNQKDYSYPVFREYLEKVFEYANTASLEKELIPVTDKIKPGDVFIIGGFPGHAVIVTDVEYHKGGLRFRCAQSWMPAQSIEYIQAFPSVQEPSPNENKTCGVTDGMWYDFLKNSMFFEISGYEFYSTNLKRFKNV